METGESFPSVKRPGREARHSPPSTIKVKKEYTYMSILSTCIHGACAFQKLQVCLVLQVNS
jgi:hypothetical protein